MAVFRDHITVGALLAAVGVVALYFYAIVTDPLLLGLLFAVTVVTSFLPDLDLDTGVPFHLVFGLFSISCGAVALYYLLAHPPSVVYLLYGVPVAVVLGVWFVGGTIFKHITHHRGMMHSVPALLIAVLATFLAVRYVELPDALAFIFAAAAGLGFLSHLMLDEVHSENVLDGNVFIPKHSLGTALKFFSNSLPTTLFAYLLLAALAYCALQVM